MCTEKAKTLIVKTKVMEENFSKKLVISSEISELQTECVRVWSEINITGTKHIAVGIYYRPLSDDGTSLENSNVSLKRINNTST